MFARLGMMLVAPLVLFQPAGADVTHIDSAQLERFLEAGIPVVDVRTSTEWRETGVIDGSHLITFFDEKGRYDVASWLARLSAIAGPDDRVVLMCRTGQRSNAVSQFLDGKVGYTRVFNVSSGISQWIGDGKATVAP